MMLKSGKAYHSIQNYTTFLLRNGERLKLISTASPCPHPYHPPPLSFTSKITTSHNPSHQSHTISSPLRFLKHHLPDEVARSTTSTSASVQGGSAPQQRLLRHRHASWLLFPLCICLSAAAGSFVPRLLIGSPPALAQSVARNDRLQRASARSASETEESHGKPVYLDYHVTGIPGDGRCLFRAVAHGSCVRSGKAAPDERTQREMADDLRNKAMDELVRRRESSEWFIEGDFDDYVNRMRKPHTWGGEPELLMLSNVLKAPITVYMKENKGIIAIAEYGQEFGSEKPIRVLYHGSGHYEAVHLAEDMPMSKL